MSPITAEEAFALTDPGLEQEARQNAAQNIMAGVAANDAYLNSRSELEQIVSRAQGGQVPPSHEELNREALAPSGEAPGQAVEGTALEESSESPSDREAEAAQLRARLAELERGQ